MEREKSSQTSRIHFGCLRDEKPGVPTKTAVLCGVEYRQVCLITRRVN
jgi:hypothetical protein